MNNCRVTSLSTLHFMTATATLEGLANIVQGFFNPTKEERAYERL
ncbi:MAG: hypothetical protein QX197_16040 [Methylococcaceae bacterium]